MKKEQGNIGELLAAGLCIVAMTVLMFSYLNFVKVFQQKEHVGQIARKYILRMETVGMLNGDDEGKLMDELAEIGVKNVNLQGTTTWQVSYGEEIVLQIRGTLEEGYDFSEKRVSTAKY